MLREWLPACVILLLALIVYIPAMRAGFVWDDDTHLINHIVLQEHGLFRAWFTTDAFVYYPVTWTSYWIEHQLWGLDPTGYHIVNVLLHAICSVLIWRVLRRLNIPGAWMAALIFALHPVGVETAAWITQRKNLLSMLFFLAAILQYLRFEERGRRRVYWLAVLLFLLAMLSKGAVVSLPVVLLLLNWWQRGAITRRDLVRSIPFFAIAIAMSFSEVFFQYVQVGASDVRQDTFIARVAGVGWVVWFYIYKTLIPINLAFVYPRWEIHPERWIAWIPNLCLLATLIVFWKYRRTWGRPALLGLLYFCLTIFPATGFVHFYYLKYSFVADHYQYISIIGVIALVVAAGWTFMKRIGLTGRSPVLTCAVPLLAALSILTWQHASVYDNHETLFRDSIAKNPTGWMALHNLANYLQDQGRVEESIPYYRETLRLNPTHESAAANLATAYLALDDVQNAERVLREAAAGQPDNELYHYEYGALLSGIGQTDEAMREWREAVRINPNHAYAHASLGYYLYERSEYADAVPHLERAIELAPDFAGQSGLPALLDEARRRAQ